MITMKNCALLVTTFAVLAFCPLGHAQDVPQDVPRSVPLFDQDSDISSTIAMARANMRADRTALITTGMNFSDQESGVFWPLYQQYEYERSKQYDRRAAVIKQYAKKYPNLTDAEAKSMAEEMFDSESRLAELKKKYYRKFNKVLPALTVAKFFQLERRVDLLMDMNVEYMLPPLTQAQDTAPASKVTASPEQ